jgi:hypothetical protein
MHIAFHPFRRVMPLVTAVSLVCCAGAWAAPEPTFLYQTQPGDTLITLGERLLARPQDWPEVGRLNHIVNPRRIPVGSTLRIPERLLQRQDRDGTVLAAVGNATVQPPTSKGIPPAAPQAVVKGAPFKAGSVVRTGGNGYVTVRLADGSVLRIQADTEARLDTSQQYESAGFFSSVWEVLRGRVEALVTHMTGGEPRFQIKTPQAVLGVRGTEFRVEADAGSALTRGETLTGAVGVGGGRGETLVKAGFGSVAAASGQVAAPRPLPPAPDLAGQPTLQERILVRFELPTVTGAVSYHAQVADDADFRLVRGDVSSDNPLLRFADLPDGDYFLRARAIDTVGLQGPDAVLRFKLKARPEAPLPSEPANGSKWRSSSVKLAWADHPQARHYRLQVAAVRERGPDFSQPLLDRQDLTSTQFDAALPPGDYAWRVATTAAGEDRGPWGDPLRFNVRPAPPAPPPPKVTEDHIGYQLQGEPGQRFEFQMARDEAFKDLVADVKASDGNVTLNKPQEGGRFLLRYRAIDADGFIGPYTAPQLLVLPSCIRSGSGDCVMGGSRFAVSPP